MHSNTVAAGLSQPATPELPVAGLKRFAEELRDIAVACSDRQVADRDQFIDPNDPGRGRLAALHRLLMNARLLRLAQAAKDANSHGGVFSYAETPPHQLLADLIGGTRPCKARTLFLQFQLLAATSSR